VAAQTRRIQARFHAAGKSLLPIEVARMSRVDERYLLPDQEIGSAWIFRPPNPGFSHRVLPTHNHPARQARNPPRDLPALLGLRP